ncbi:MAG TPA: hypothetical protein VN253_28975 [Kofleriaceae bacterium]|nr:hypothetical protein [Kofleriaceae bacterium]
MLFAALAGALAGCPGDELPACATVDTACMPLYDPTFANVYNTTLRVGCGSQLSSCHARGGAGGMSLEDPDTAYQSLLAGRVKPGDPGCSEMIVRTTESGKDYAMPPGAPLSAAERCSLILWVERGAPGPVMLHAGGAP